MPPLRIAYVGNASRRVRGSAIRTLAMVNSVPFFLHRTSTPRTRSRWGAGGVALLGFVATACSGGASGSMAPPGDGGGIEPPLGIDTGALPSLPAIEVPAWQPVELSFRTGVLSPVHGGAPREADRSPGNPWLDWRMDLALTRPDGAESLVPGFFAGDGEEGSQGDVWKVRFTPPAIPGVWNGTLILRYGHHLNISTPGSTAGIPVFGRTFQLSVTAPELSAPGFFGKGPIEADGAGRLRHADRTLFVKAGAGSPENLLGYEGFDGAVDGIDGGPMGEAGGAPNFLHAFEPHRGDWTPGDPDWENGRGRPIIGALNYLASVGANAIYLLPMNLGGDGRDTFPFVSNSGGARFPNDPADALSYAVKRLSQWDLVLRHAQTRGLLVQFVLAEREPTNIGWLGGAMSVRRRLFLKQLVAHFGYLPGLEWTLCEENSVPGASTFAQFTPSELRQIATWIRGWDSMRHPRSVHIDFNDLSLYSAMIAQGEAGWIECLSLQINGDNDHTARLYGDLAEDAAGQFLDIGRRVIPHVDEPGNYLTGVGSELHPDAWSGSLYAGAEDRRRRILYDSLFSGAGILWYFGLYTLAEGGGDLTTEDFRTRDTIFRQTTHARELIEDTFRDAGSFGPADALWASDTTPLHPVYGEAEVLAERLGGPASSEVGHVLVYLPALGASASTSPGQLAPLRSVGSGSSFYRAAWINPRTGIEEGAPRFFDPTQPFWPEPPAGAPLDPDVDWILRVTAR